MTLVYRMQKNLSLGTKGKFSRSNGYGRIRFGYNYRGMLNDFAGIYQRKKTSAGWRTSRMRFYRPTNPQTTAQQAWRAKMAEMWAQYALLTPDEKVQLSKEARRYRLSGPSLFARRYLKAQSS